MIDQATDYAEEVAGGKVLAGELIRHACNRHLRNKEESPELWNREDSEYAIRFFSFLVHSKGQHADQPFILQPWQAFCIGSIYGWKRKNGTRRFRRASIWVPKKNGKSTMAAGLVLYGMVAEGEPGAEVYGAAADREQASIIYREVATMVTKSPTLRKKLSPIDSTKRVVFRKANAFYQVLSKEARKTGHGVNASLAVIDEMHVVDRELYDTLRYAGAARTQPLMIEISTAGNDMDSLGYERYIYASKLLKGEIEDEETFAYIAEADSNEVWQDREQWRKANPSLGITISEESFEGDFNEAMQSAPAAQANFKQLRLNLWQRSIFSWIPLEKWDKCQADEFPDLHGVPCYGGLDLSANKDLTAFALVWKIDGLYWFKVKFWVPIEGDRRREAENRTKFGPWIKDGYMAGCPRETIDTDMVEKEIKSDAEKYSLQEVAYDDWNAGTITDHLLIHGIQMVEFQQSLKNYNGPMKEFEKLILEGKVRHDGNPVMRWCVSNVAVLKDSNGNIRPHKEKSVDRIDGVCASIMALARAMGEGQSVYENQGIMQI